MSGSLIMKVEAGAALESAEAEALMEEVLGGRLDTPAIVRLLMALNARPYRATELAAFARVMRRHAARVFAEGETPPANMVDTCGTGGDGAQTFNISSAAAIVAAASGARVAKHGNRAASSLSGSADVLEALGVFSADVLELVAETLRDLGTERAMVIHGAGGLDEISLSGPTKIAEVKDGRILRYEVTPEEFGMKRAPVEEIRGDTAAENATLIRKIFGGERGPSRDIVAINAGAALMVTGIVKTLREGAEIADAAIESGAAKRKLEEMMTLGGD